MGWTGYYPTHFTKKGTVDRKAECDAYFMEGLNRGTCEVLKSTLIGSVYYAAVKRIKGYNGNELVDIPEEEQIVEGYVFLTSIRDGDFYYKEMHESMGPYESKCPVTIIRLLSPTDNDFANAWRQRCLENANAVNGGKLQLHTIIEFEYNNKTYRLIKTAPMAQFKTAWWRIVDTNKYFPKKEIPWTDVRIVEPEK